LDTALEKLNTINTSRIRKPPNRYGDSESSNNEDRELFTHNQLKKRLHKNNRLTRPPIISGN